MVDLKEKMIKEIENLRDDFYRSSSNMSFSPEIRASQRVAEFSAELEEDLAELGERAGNYKIKYITHLQKWNARMARCMSPMITGAANFPAEANRKRLLSAAKAWDEFQAWRERYIKRANAIPTKTPEEEIDDAIIKLEKERNAHTLMVEINKITRRKVSDEEKRKAFAEELELSPAMVEKLMVPDFIGRFGFASYALTNSNARIKNLEEKILVMHKRIERRDAFEPIVFDGGSINIEDDRVVIKHAEKPSREIIDAIKARGFHWSPKSKYWCRKHTANALRDAKEICGVK